MGVGKENKMVKYIIPQILRCGCSLIAYFAGADMSWVGNFSILFNMLGV